MEHGVFLESGGELVFDDTDKELDKPDSNQRRSAIQHLRAAVAATRYRYPPLKEGNE